MALAGGWIALIVIAVVLLLVIIVVSNSVLIVHQAEGSVTACMHTHSSSTAHSFPCDLLTTKRVAVCLLVSGLVIERLGKFHRVATPGINFVVQLTHATRGTHTQPTSPMAIHSHTITHT